MNETKSLQERHWHKGSWLALSFALLLFGYSTILIWRLIQVPGDGWDWSGDFQSLEPEIIFDYHVIGPPSPIRENDKLLTIEGESVAALEAKRFFWQRTSPPDWPDGTVLTYVVERENQAITLAVPVRRYSFGELLVAGFRTQGLAGLVQVAGSTFFFAIGIIVFFMRPQQRAAHALLILGTAFLFNAVPAPEWVTAVFYSTRPPSVPFDTWIMGINPSLMLMALAFPVPKLPMRRFPRLTTLFLYLWAPFTIDIAYLLNLDNPPGYYQTANAVYVLQILLLFVLVFGSLLHSTFTLQDRVARNQLKWVGLGLASFIVPGVGGWLLGFMFLGFQSDVVYFISVMGWFIMPICLAIAITRYRLFDIDVIIRKTLVYAVLTGVLALVYFGVVVLLQTIFGSFSGQQSPIGVVLSTLLIAALFAPLRQRVQAFIDRRFYRQKYDAQQILTHFAQTARDEVSLEALTAELNRIVEETMQPEQATIWLKTGKK